MQSTEYFLKSTACNVRTELTIDTNNKNTTERTYANNDISYPQLFSLLASDQQRDAVKKLSLLPVVIRQAVLDEWAIRCVNEAIRSPAGYLFGMIKKARHNEFRPCAILKHSNSR